LLSVLAHSNIKQAILRQDIESKTASKINTPQFFFTC
jgi:hypothetical protein